MGTYAEAAHGKSEQVGLLRELHALVSHPAVPREMEGLCRL